MFTYEWNRFLNSNVRGERQHIADLRLEAKNLLQSEGFDINATYLEGPHRGKTILWLAAAHGELELVKDLLQKYPNADINAAPLEGPYKGVTVLWLVAFSGHWKLFEAILESFPNADLHAAPLEAPYNEDTPFSLAADYAMAHKKNSYR